VSTIYFNFVMTNKLFTCKLTACKATFRSYSQLNYHVKCNHQSNVTIKFLNGDVMEVKRGQDKTFRCKCGKSFNYPDSLRKHAKGCNSKLIKLEEDGSEGVLMNVDDTDTLESMNLDVSVVPNDCYGSLISHEND
jgi:hypothetical protein